LFLFVLIRSLLVIRNQLMSVLDEDYFYK